MKIELKRTKSKRWLDVPPRRRKSPRIWRWQWKPCFARIVEDDRDNTFVGWWITWRLGYWFLSIETWK